MARLGNIFSILFLTSALAAIVATGWLVREIKAPGPLGAEKLVYVRPGSSLQEITAKLLEAEAIRNGTVFLIAARWRSGEGYFRAGEYNFPAGISISDVIALLQSGQTWQRKITIPEGLMIVEITALLQNEAALDGSIDASPPEGSLLPETYNFSYGDTRQSIIERMKKSMQKELDARWEKRAAGLPLKTPQEAVVLASVVEKETGLAAERPRIAGVFINRLNQGIPLQSDPTVIYALTLGRERLNRALTHQDLKIPSAYNTYSVAGLPPAPIANPGKASLAAVMNPEKNGYIYFVADGSGGHVFARTLKEHNNNVARWRKVRKNPK